jgi:hypothetical protein
MRSAEFASERSWSISVCGRLRNEEAESGRERNVAVAITEPFWSGMRRWNSFFSAGLWACCSAPHVPRNNNADPLQAGPAYALFVLRKPCRSLAPQRATTKPLRVLFMHAHWAHRLHEKTLRRNREQSQTITQKILEGLKTLGLCWAHRVRQHSSALSRALG